MLAVNVALIAQSAQERRDNPVSRCWPEHIGGHAQRIEDSDPIRLSHWLSTNHTRPCERRQGEAAGEFPTIDH
jgi:hypothetical protein